MENVNLVLNYANGSSIQINDVVKNGSCYISDNKIDDLIGEIFSNVTDGTEEIGCCEVVDIWSNDGKFWFSFLPISNEELKNRELESKIEYIAMMSGIEWEV